MTNTEAHTARAARAGRTGGADHTGGAGRTGRAARAGGATTSPIRCYDAEVLAVRDLGGVLRRVTLGSPELEALGVTRHHRDLRVKLVPPVPGRERFDLPGLMAAAGPGGFSWYQSWLAVDPAERGSMRTYTVRALRHTDHGREIDIDLVMHLGADGSEGPGSAWARHAEAGDRIHLVGPDRHVVGRTVDALGDDAAEAAVGVEFRPHPGAEEFILSGDESALPAIASILEHLPAAARGHAVLEVPGAADVQDLAGPDGIRIHWVVRDGAPRGAEVLDLVRRLVPVPPGREEQDTDPVEPEGQADDAVLWDVPHAADGEPPTGPFAWIAGESATVKALRRYLVREVGADRRAIAFMGYWKAGRAES